MALIWAEPLCDELLFGSALQQGRDIVRIQKGAKDWHSYILGSCGIRYSALQQGRDIVIHPERDQKGRVKSTILPFSRVETLSCIQKGDNDWYSYILGSFGVHYRNISSISEGSTWVQHGD